MDEDFYEFLEVAPSASPSQIKKAYRKKALQLHPDKNLENPTAKKEFEHLSKVVDILTDPETRKEYDRLQKAKKDRKIRDSELDSRRKRFKDLLEEKEKKAKESKEGQNGYQDIERDINREREKERIHQINLKILDEENEKLRIKAEREHIIATEQMEIKEETSKREEKIQNCSPFGIRIGQSFQEFENEVLNKLRMAQNSLSR